MDFGTSSPGAFQGNQSATTFDTGSRSDDTTYYGCIDEVNAGGTTTGSVWSFTTIVGVPGQPSSPRPADIAAAIDVHVGLGWSYGSGAVRHEVNIATSNTGEFQGNPPATTFSTDPTPNTYT